MKKLSLLLTVGCLILTGALLSGCNDSLVFPDQTTTTVSTSSTTTTILPQVSAPTFTVAAGTYEADSLTVTIECSTPGAEIYYTTGASSAGLKAAVASPATLTIDSSQTITAFASKTGMSNSNPASATYDLYGWSAIGSGVSGTVNDITINGTDIYLSGDFSIIGQGRYFASWDGTNWDYYPPGNFNGMEGKALQPLGNFLYAVGSWSDIDSVPQTKGIARWHTTNLTWESVGGGCSNNTVPGQLLIGTDLYVACNQDLMGNVPGTRGIARWNTLLETWEAIGGGIDLAAGNGFCLATDGTNIYFGGSFTQVGGQAISRIARWTGSTWEALGTGTSGNVRAIVWDGTNLYAGGEFATAGGVTVNKVAKWNGSSWSTLGSGMDNGTVYALALDSNNTLYAGGTFTSVSGVSNTVYIARWTGSTWEAVNGGARARVYALENNNGSIYVGGSFTAVGEVPANRIAKWGKK